MNLKTGVTAVFTIVIVFFLALWLDSIILGGTWQDYLLMGVVETGCFFLGIFVGWVAWGTRR